MKTKKEKNFNKPQRTQRAQREKNSVTSVPSVAKKIRLFLCVVCAFAAVVLGIAVFSYPFPGECYECSLFQKLSGLLFSVLGVTAFFLPLVILMALFFWKKEKIRKYIKLALLLWLPVLLNLALLGDLLEIKANIGGIAGWIFTYAHEHKIDFILLFLPIIAIDLLILHLLGVNIAGLFKKGAAPPAQ